MKSFKQRFSSAVSVLLICVSMILAVFSLTVALRKDSVTFIFGWASVQLLSGSMEPTYSVGDFLIIKKVNADEVKKGDVICFISPDPDIYGLNNTHRVVDVTRDDSDRIFFTTKGDANPENDAYTVSEDRVIGIVVSDNTVLSKILFVIKSRWGFFTLVIIPLFIVLTVSIQKFAKAVRVTASKEGDTEYEQNNE